MPPKPQPFPTKPTRFDPPESLNTVAVVYMSPGVVRDGGGFVIIVATDKNGNQFLKKVPVGPGPGDPGGGSFRPLPDYWESSMAWQVSKSFEFAPDK